MKTKTIFGAVVLAALALPGCNQETTSNAGPDKTSLPGARGNTPAANSNGMDSNSAGMENTFVTEAAVGGMAEVELGRMAQTKAQNAEVKRFAQMMIDDHSKANDELKSLATRKNFSLPTSLDAKHQSTMQKLQGMSGAEFDKAYVDNMLEDHEKDVAEFENQSQNNPDADLKAFAAKTLPTLKKHLDTIKGIHGKMK